MVKKNTQPKLKEAGTTQGSPKSFRNLLTFRLHMVARLSERVSEEYYRRSFDLSLPECRVIGITGGYGTVSFKKVAADTYLEKSYASRVVSNLVDRGIIKKLDNPEDSRSVLLTLTEKGLKVHEDMHRAAIRLNDWLTANLVPEQAAGFVSTLSQLESRLESLGQSFDQIEDVTQAIELTSAMTPPADTVEIDRALAQTLAHILSAQLKQ